MLLKYLGPFSDVEFENYGTVKRGNTIELPDEIAKQKLKRNPKSWAKVKEKNKNREV